MVKVIAAGFGGILGYIGLVIVFGTVIGIVLERTGVAIVMAETMVRLIGKRFPTLCMSVVGAIVSVPVFCDSGFVILNSLRRSLSKKLKVSGVAMSTALATGLFATHTLVPPTPGPIAAAGNLGLDNALGVVIIVGLVVSVPTVLAGWLWSNVFLKEPVAGEEEHASELHHDDESPEQVRAKYGKLPSAFMSFLPIVLPVVLICLSSIVDFPTKPLGDNYFATTLSFLGKPLVALLIGMFSSFFLLIGMQGNKIEAINKTISEGLTVAAPILLITGVGGAFGAVLKETPLGDYLGTLLSGLGLGIFMPFVVAAALKSAQGSSTLALVTASAIVAPLLPQLGMDSEMARVLVVMAIGAGVMTVSHANDSFFWVVSQFSRMSASQAYRSLTVATGLQGIVCIVVVWILSLIFV